MFILLILVATAFKLMEALGFRDGVRTYPVYGSKRRIAVPKYLTNDTVEPNEYVAAVVEYPTPLDHLTFTLPKSKFLPCLKLIHGDGFCPEDRYSIAEHASVFGAYGMKLLNHSQLRKNPDFLKKGSRLQNLVSKNSFEVRFKDGSKYPLEDDPFSHRRGVFSSSPKDFFLIRGTNAIPLAKRMKDNGMDTIFGPLTLKFFEEIGYSTRRKQQKLILKTSEPAMQVLKVIDPQRERYNSWSAYI